MLRITIATSLVLLMIGLPCNLALSAPIDNFDSSLLLTPPPVPASQVDTFSPGPNIHFDSGAGVTSVFGDSRRVELGAFSGGVTDSNGVSIGGGIISYSSSNSGDSSLRLTYDAGAPTVDLSGEAGVMFDVITFDFANGVPLPITVTLDDGTNTAFINASASAATPPGIPFEMEFADFTNIGSVDLSAVQSIDFFFDAQVAHDFDIDSIRTFQIPEPTSIAIWAVLGMLSVAGAIRLRRRK